MRPVALAAPTNAEAIPTRAGLGTNLAAEAESADAWSAAKGGVAAKEFVAAEAGQSHFQSRLARGPGDEVGVDAVHAGKVERAQRFFQALESLFPEEQELAMVGSQAVCGGLGNLRFAEIDFREKPR